MKRRDFITLLSGAVATWPLSGHAQQAAAPSSDTLVVQEKLQTLWSLRLFDKVLTNEVLATRKRSLYAYRWSEGDYSKLPQLATDLVGRKVNVIVASGLPAALAAKAATSTIPIVFRLAIDPVAFVFVQSFDRP